MWQTRRLSMKEMALLIIGAILLLAAPVVLYLPAVLEPLVRLVSPMLSLHTQWLIFGMTAPLGLALIALPLALRLEQLRLRLALAGLFLLMCVLWVAVMPGDFMHSSKIGAIASSAAGVVILLLMIQRRRRSASRGFDVTAEHLPETPASPNVPE